MSDLMYPIIIGGVIVGFTYLAGKASMGSGSDEPRLISIKGYGKDVRVLNSVYPDLLALQKTAREEGIKSPLLLPTSGYRDSRTQARLYAETLAKYGPEKASLYRAPPGRSVHETGRAVDFFLGFSNDVKNIGEIKKSKVWKWLNEHGERFNFFPYVVEPWHWEWGTPHSGDSTAVALEIKRGIREGYLT